MVTTYTVAQYKTWLRGRRRGINFEDALLTDAINSTNREICNAAVWPFMETEFVGTAASGTRSYALNTTITNYQLALGLQLTDPNNKAVDVGYLTWREWDELYPDPGQLTAATPSKWTLFGSTLFIGPANMDQTYTFRLPYLKEPTDLTADATVVDVPDAFAEVLITGALYRAMLAKGKGNIAQLIRQDYDGGDDNHNKGLFGDMKNRLLPRQKGQIRRMRTSTDWNPLVRGSV